MTLVETERQGQIFIIRLNRPERMNAMGKELLREMGEAFILFKDDSQLEVAILTGSGRAFCAGEDMKESLEKGEPGSDQRFVNPFMDGDLEKPVGPDR